MTRILNEQYSKIGLSDFVNRLSEDCYIALEKLCESAEKQANKLDGLESQLATSQYTTLCNALIQEIKQCLAVRKEIYIPYIQTLVHKIADQHDCSSCSGSCKVNHDMQLLELKASHSNIKGILYRLQMVSLPLYSETIYPDAYRILRNQMALIENNLTELFFLEEHYLIPKVVEAQKVINAGN